MTDPTADDVRDRIAEELVEGWCDQVKINPETDFPALADAVMTVVAPILESLAAARTKHALAAKGLAKYDVELTEEREEHAAELGRLRAEYRDSEAGHRRALAELAELRSQRDEARDQFLDHYNGTSGQLDRLRELEAALRTRTDERDQARAERNALSIMLRGMARRAVSQRDDARREVAKARAETARMRVIKGCPVSGCVVDIVHGHQGYGLRYLPAEGAVDALSPAPNDPQRGAPELPMSANGTITDMVAGDVSHDGHDGGAVDA